MDIQITRINTSDQGTLGVLTGDGFFCFVLELPWRDNAANISCIPAGEYECLMRYSARFGKNFAWIKDVPGRTSILIHSGNVAGAIDKGWDTHSAGCILLGKRPGIMAGQKAVFLSRPVVRQFNKFVGNEFTLKISWAPDSGMS